MARGGQHGRSKRGRAMARRHGTRRLVTVHPVRRFLAVSALVLGAVSAVPGHAQRSPVEALDPETIRGVMRRVADWQLAQPVEAPSHWSNAVLSVGLLAAWETTGEERYRARVLETATALDWRLDGAYRHADTHAIAQSYLRLLAAGEPTATAAHFQQAIDRMMATPPDWEEKHQVIDYWWSDALFMSPPALVDLARATGDERYLDFMDELWRQSYEILWAPQARLFYRDKRFRFRAPGEFWSRGNAWVLSGLALILDRMPADRPSRSFYLDVFRRMAARVAALQRDDGLWRASLLSEKRSAPGETSGSALFCHALAWGVRSGALEAGGYLPAIERAWAGLTASVDDDGRLGWVQKPAASPGAVKRRHSANYGTGAFLLAGSEMARLANDRER